MLLYRIGNAYGQLKAITLLQLVSRLMGQENIRSGLSNALHAKTMLNLIPVFEVTSANSCMNI